MWTCAARRGRCSYMMKRLTGSKSHILKPLTDTKSNIQKSLSLSSFFIFFVISISILNCKNNISQVFNWSLTRVTSVKSANKESLTRITDAKLCIQIRFVKVWFRAWEEVFEAPGSRETWLDAKNLERRKYLGGCWGSWFSIGQQVSVPSPS